MRVIVGIVICWLTYKVEGKSENTACSKVPKESHVYAKVPEHTADLVLLEEDLVKTLLKEYKNILHFSAEIPDKCFVHLYNYLTHYLENEVPIHSTKSKSTRVSENPLLTMRVIRRLVEFLDNVDTECDNENYLGLIDTVDKVFRVWKVSKPTQQDLDEALIGLLILHFTYGFDIKSQLLIGKFKIHGASNEIESNVVLTFDECYEVAKTALFYNWLVLAYQWTEALQELAYGNEITNEDAGLLENLWQELVVEANVSSVEQLKNEMHGKRQESLVLEEKTLSYEHLSLCRGQSLMSPEVQANLNCFYDQGIGADISDPSPYFYINPVKVELVSEDPTVIQFYDFVTNRDIEQIQTKGSRFTSNGMKDNVLRNIDRKIEMITGLQVRKLEVNFQRGLYTPLGNFHNMEKLRGEYVPFDLDRLINLVAIFLINLNDTPMGGNLAFPEAGAFAEPIKGSAISWLNWEYEENQEEQLEPKSCPVVFGSKIIANRALDLFSQCDLEDEIFED